MTYSEMIKLINKSDIDFNSLNIIIDNRCNEYESLSCWQEDGRWFLCEVDDRGKELKFDSNEDEIMDSFYSKIKMRLSIYNVVSDISFLSLEEILAKKIVKENDADITNTWALLSKNDVDIFLQFKYWVVKGELLKRNRQCKVEGFFIEDIASYTKENMLKTFEQLLEFRKVGIVENYLLNKYDGNSKRVEIDMVDLRKYRDILQEFRKYIIFQNFEEDAYAVSVEGYTAKKLFDSYRLSEVGAFNFLVYLREEPKDALADLQAGLPRK